LPFQERQQILFIAFSPNGKLLASSNHEEHEIRLWEKRREKNAPVDGAQSVVDAVVFCARGKDP